MDELVKTVKSLPSSAGIYQYFDKNGKLLYIGKAKNLKNRVKSYFAFTPTLSPSADLSPRIHKMISEAATLEYIVVASENDALVLENSLIKQLKPKYNILLRDDKTYPYIYIDLSKDFPRFEITRKVVRGKNIRYFGPFTTGGRELLSAIYEIFPLVQRKGNIKGRKKCLFWQIGRCLAPCEGLITPYEYKKIVDEAIDLINNKNKILSILEQKMSIYSEKEQYEEAIKVRDQIQSIRSSVVQSGVDFAKNEFFDVIATASIGSQAVAVRLFVRDGKVISASHESFSFVGEYDPNEAYKRAFLSFYIPNIPVTATKICIENEFEELDLIQSHLEKNFGKKFTIVVPKIGAKKEIISLAKINALEILKKIGSSGEAKLMDLFGLDLEPKRIEVFDNSHMMGTATVGAMVVYDGEFKKPDYRHYNLTNHDEYAQMQELLSRRAQSFATNPPPDLWLIDGGETLRRLAVLVLESAGVNLPVVAIAKEKLDSKAHRAKGSAKDLLYYEGKEFKLLPSDKRLQFLQRLRDEAHRFAITFHQRQKRKEDMKISMLEKKGISKATLKLLLDLFGTYDAIEKATYQEVVKLAGEKIAKSIKGTNEV